jgi:hypothetical protein
MLRNPRNASAVAFRGLHEHLREILASVFLCKARLS